MSGRPKWKSEEDRNSYERDLALYGNGFVHCANINGELVLRRLDPAEVLLKPPVAADDLTG